MTITGAGRTAESSRHHPEPMANTHSTTPAQPEPATTSVAQTTRTAVSNVLGYVPEFDGLRGLAAIGVVGYHYLRASQDAHPAIAGLVNILGHQPGSVDMFFVLSGFLIASILLHNRDASNYYSTFFVRRCLRILPLYYAWIAVYFVFLYWTPGYGIVQPEGYSNGFIVTIYLTMLQNNVVSVLEGSPWVATSWTLGVEEPFYILAPICVRLVRSRRRLAFVFAGVVALSFLFRLWAYLYLDGGTRWGTDAAYAAYFWTPARLGAPALGCLLALAWADSGAQAWIRRNVRLFYGGVVVMMVSGLLLERGLVPGLPVGNLLQALLERTTLMFSGLFLITAVLADREGLVARLMRLPLMQRAGTLSYGLYLTHWGILWFMARFVVGGSFEADPWLGLKLAPFAFLTCWGLSELSWKYFEGPLVKIGQSYRYVKAGTAKAPAAVRPEVPRPVTHTA